LTSSNLAVSALNLWKKIIDGLHQFDERTNGWLGLITSAIDRAIKPNSTITAAAIAYFAILSLFPLTLLSIAIASYSLGPSMDQQLIIRRLEFITPALGQLVGKNIDEIITARGPVTGVALLGLLWSASTVFNTFTHALNEVWGVKKRRPVWKGRGVAILFILAFVGPILFLASFADSILSILLAWLPVQIVPIVRVASLLSSILLNIAMFMGLYIMFPHGASTWREFFPGAIGAGLLWEFTKKAFLYFVSSYISASNLVYGSVAAIIAILTWAYVSGLIFLFGAYLSVAFFQLKQQKNAKAGETHQATST